MVKMIKIAAFVAVLWALLGCDSLEKNQLSGSILPERPNILWIVAEDLSPIIPPFGDLTVDTPNLTRLADEGVRFTRVFSTSGVCAPSRASIATGMYQNRIGAHHMRTTSAVGEGPAGLIPYEVVPPPYVKMQSQYFREAGYYTSNNAKEDYQFRKPVTAWDDSSPQAHWRNRASGQPFFSIFNIGITHESQVWRQRDNPLLLAYDAEVPIPPYLPETDIAVRDIRQVYSNIIAMDREIGKLLSQLEEDDLVDDTIIFFYSDHGGPLPRQKRLLYDSGIQVPLIIRFPGKWRAGEIDDQLISFVDFKSTTLSLAGIEPPAYSDGRAFLGDFVETPTREYIHAAADRFDNEYDTIRAVRDSRYKYLRNYNLDKAYYLPLPYREQMPIMRELLQLNEQGKLNRFQAQWFREQKPLEELFDTDIDPYELENLAQDPAYSNKLKELSDELDSWLLEVEDLGFTPENELIEHFWPGGVQPVTEVPSMSIIDGEIHISSATPGANIAFQVIGLDQASGSKWQVYLNPVKVIPSRRVVAIAHRIGYAPSQKIELYLD
ncbi:MAG: sulfatase [Pseudohongiellaceae bacterium]